LLQPLRNVIISVAITDIRTADTDKIILGNKEFRILHFEEQEKKCELRGKDFLYFERVEQKITK
jgi:hypothetical protein